MKKILCIGSSGFVGNAFVSLKQDESQIFETTRDLNSIDKIYFDITKEETINNLPTDIDCVVYLAQSKYYKLGISFIDDIYQVNVSGVFNVLSWAIKNSIKKFVYVSTATVCNALQKPFDLISESSNCSPNTIYGNTKFIGEKTALLFAEKIDIVIARLCTVYGKGQEPTFTIPNLIKKVQKNEEVIYDVDLYTTIMNVEDVAKILHNIIKANLSSGSIINISSDEHLNIKSLYQTIVEYYHAPYKFKMLYSENNPIKSYCLSNNYAKSLNLLPQNFKTFKEFLSQYDNC